MIIDVKNVQPKNQKNKKKKDFGSLSGWYKHNIKIEIAYIHIYTTIIMYNKHT